MSTCSWARLANSSAAFQSAFLRISFLYKSRAAPPILSTFCVPLIIESATAPASPQKFPMVRAYGSSLLTIRPASVVPKSIETHGFR